MEKKLLSNVSTDQNVTECPVPILQDMKEFNVFLKIVSDMRPKNVMEIGSFYGGTLWYWLQYFWNLRYVVSLDWPVPKSDGRFQEMTDCRSKWAEWIDEYTNYQRLENKQKFDFHNIIGISQHHQTIQQVKAVVPAGDLDMLFIDGGHHYDEVRQDYQNYKDLVSENGIIVFHDVCGLSEVKRFWNELKSDKTYLEINNPPGWGIGVIFNG